MTKKQEREGSLNWADIMACQYCVHYSWIGTQAQFQVCVNGDSPYYDNSAQELLYGTKLTTEQKIMGCDKIIYNGEKIPPHLYKLIPKDSKLRKIPLDKIVEGFNEKMDLESSETVKRIAKRYDKEYKALIRAIYNR